jgi:hypothetical protein
VTRPANVRLLAGQDVSAGESFSLNGKDFQFATIQVGVNPSDLVESRLETPFRPSNTLML